MRPHANLPLVVSAILFELLLSTAYSQVFDRDAVEKITGRASYEFSNEQMYRDQNTWIGQTITFKGSFLSRTDVINLDRPYEQIQGSSSAGDPIDMIVVFQGDFIAPQTYGRTGRSVSRGYQLRVFGIVQKCREVIGRTGAVRVLPVLDLLAVFNPDDQGYQDPVWVSKDLRR